MEGTRFERGTGWTEEGVDRSWRVADCGIEEFCECEEVELEDEEGGGGCEV